ncbi:MAG: hypothetical protein ACKO8I_11740 [Cyanobacteriota bacterium]
MPALLVGIPTVFLGLSLLTGSISDAALLITVSVICTVGIGGLFWLGLAMVLGIALLYVAESLARIFWRHEGFGLFPGGGDRSGVSLPAPLRQRRHQVLERYVTRRLEGRSDPVHIRRDLLQAGWSAEQVDGVLQSATGG